LAFDPECDWKGREGGYLQRAWNGLGATKKWQKDVLVTVCFRYLDTGKKMPRSFSEQVWCEETPAHIRDDRDFAICLLTVTDVSRIRLAWDFFEHKPFVVAAVKFSPMVLIDNLILERSLEDEDVFLAYTEIEPELWKNERIQALVSRFSPEIRAKRSLMLALVKICGMCIRYINEPFKADLDIVRAAFEQDPISFLHAKKQARQALLGDKDSTLHLFDRWPRLRNSRRIGHLYRSLPTSLQRDRDIVEKLLSRGDLAVQDFSAAVPRNRDFWLSACRQCYDSSFKLQLPVEYHDDPEFMVLFRFDSLEEVGDTLRTSPWLASDRTFWTCVIMSEQISGNWDLQNVIANHAVQEIRQDRDLMLLACKQEAQVYQILDAWLQEDREIVEATIDEFRRSNQPSDEPFFFLRLNVQVIYPDLTLAALRQVDSTSVQIRQIAVDLRSDMEVMKAWLDNNRHENIDDLFLERLEEFPEAMRNNEEFCLYAARTSCDSVSWFEIIA